MDRRDDAAKVNYEAFSALSLNGGTSYGTNLLLSASPSNPFATRSLTSQNRSVTPAAIAGDMRSR
jgi:hypothetical protein